MYSIAVIPGDGIGPEVMDSTINLLECLDVEFNFKFAWAGEGCYQQIGTNLPSETVRLAKNSDAVLFGAVTTVPGQSSAIITLRKTLDLYANLRPVRSYPGIKTIYSDLDFVIIRENSEGLYSGIEEFSDGGATALRVITHRASQRICKKAFEYALQTGKRKVTAVHKANILKKTDGVFKDAFYNIARAYPQIKAEDFYIDAMAMYLITQPQQFEIIVTTNLFGDILSDEAAGLVGGLGLAPSANLGDNLGLFEPVHGSAPDIAGKGIANPAAMILSAIMMLDYLRENEAARHLEEALIKVLKSSKYLTPDLGGQGTTKSMTMKIKENLTP